ncbi:hypothetical protein C8Q77DRAFT_1120547 [Trametes polyzona]|nr:hypothetical protein C8Q77DRAFT_1120547 [Trametes polyzona]
MDINEDVFVIIAQNLLQHRASLSKLSLCCRRFRQMCLPLLFSECVVACDDPGLVPPSSIRPYIRHITYNWHMGTVANEFGAELPYLPRLHSVTFERPAYGIPWSVVESCISYPNIKTIRFDSSARFTRIAPYPRNVLSASSHLEELSYPSSIVLPQPSVAIGGLLIPKEDLRALETACLSTLVLSMHRTARSLSLPLETAPIEEMASVDWPALQRLTLEGSAPHHTVQHLSVHMPAMLRRVRGLRSLILRSALPRSTTGRLCILGHHSVPDTQFQDLRSLVLSYPEPSDAVFSSSMPNLLHLSLRDWPRHYDYRVLPHYHASYRSPILSATETLSIVERLHVAELRTLEIVYRADAADDDLLQHLVDAFPKLRHLEIHRYRQKRGSTVDYEHITSILSSLKTLVTVRLHLDFKDDPGAYAIDIDYEVADSWYPKLVKRGWELLEALGACPQLESVALLYTAKGPGVWVWFDRSQLAVAGRKPVRDHSLEQQDSPTRPSRWRREKKPCSPTCEYCETCARPLKRCRSWSGPLETVAG